MPFAYINRGMMATIEIYPIYQLQHKQIQNNNGDPISKFVYLRKGVANR